MRKIWGSVQGERFWYLMRGNEIPEIKTRRGTIGHSHVLHPHWRTRDKSKKILRRLLIKAASRLRRTGYYSTKLSISLRIENGKKLEEKIKFRQLCDNFTLLEKSELIWKNLTSQYLPKKITKISINLYGLKKTSTPQLSLFKEHEDEELIFIKRRETLSKTIDNINFRFGKDSIILGNLPKEISEFSKTKIAFTRIPSRDEFCE